MAADTRDRILDALEKLLLVSGVAQVTLEGVAAEAGVSKGHDEIQKAVTHVMRSWDKGLQTEIADPIQAEIIRLVGDGLYLAAMLGLPQPDPELHRQVVERLRP
jgi:hypothetical protein